MSTRRIPGVVDDLLVTPEGTIRLGSRAWFQWLNSKTPRSFSYKTPRATLTLRREQKRNGEYWYAYRTHDGKLRKAYAGKTAELTPERLRALAATLSEQAQTGARVRLELFGVARALRGGETVALNPKALALLAYLAAHADPVSREQIITLLWQDSAPDAARKNLRNLLWHIRTLLTPDLILGVQELSLDAPAGCDVCAFRQAQRELARASASLRPLQTIRKLYRGEFLSGFALDDAPEFEVWLTGARERYHEAYLDALQALVTAYRAHDKWKQVAEIAHAAISQDPLQEPMYRALMEAHAQLGDRAAALRHYDTLHETLDRELGVAPLPETQELRAAIVSGTLSIRPRETARRTAAPKPETPGPFVGRAREMAELDAAWRAAQQGGARVALLAGEAGIGKSRLWEAWAKSLAPEPRMWTTRSLPAANALPFAPLADVLRSPAACERFAALAKPVPPAWLSDLARLVPEVREFVPNLAAPPHLPPVEEQRHLFEALVMALGVSERQGVVLFLDDLQWTDRSTLDWLSYLVFRARGMPLLFAGAYRPEEAAPPLVNLIAQWSREGIATRLNLSRLDRGESAALVRALRGDEARADELYRQSAGNPYFLIELLRAEPGAIPTALADLIETRVNRLDEAARQVLQAAAVLQADITFPLLEFTSGRTDDETLDAIDVLREAGLLVEQGDGYAPGHPLIAAVVDRALSGARRMRLHRRAAEALERAHASDPGAVAGRLLRHFAEAGDTPRAAHYAQIAAERALALAAPNEAVQLYERALALAPTPAREFGLGEALNRAGDLANARKRFERALVGYDAANERGGAARACMELARTYLSTGQADQVIAWIQRGRSYISAGDAPATQALAEYLMGTELRAAGTELQTAELHFERALDLAKRSDASDLIGDILMELGNTRAQRGDLQGAIECYRAMIERAEKHDEQNVLVVGYNNLAYHLLLAGETNAAREAIEKGLALADALDIQMARQWLYSTRGEVALAEHAWDTAREWFERGTVIAERYGNRQQMTNYEMNLALAARGRGDLDEAVVRLENARKGASSEQARFLQAQIELWLAQVYQERGESAAARDALGRAEAQVKAGPFDGLRAWAERLRNML